MIEKDLGPKTIKCPTCGRDLRFKERSRIDGGNTIICNLCYADMLYPLLREYNMEGIDAGNRDSSYAEIADQG